MSLVVQRKRLFREFWRRENARVGGQKQKNEAKEPLLETFAPYGKTI